MIWRKTTFICAVLLSVLTHRSNAKDCPANWWKYNGFCYLNTGNKMTFGDGQSFCSYFLESELLYVVNPEENIFAMNVTGEKSWLGYKRCNEQRFFWTDSEPVNFTLWDTHNNQPDNKDTNEQCVSMSPSGNWSDSLCISKKQFVCQKFSPKCKSAKDCYVLQKASVNWNEARSKCQATGLQFAKISSEDENDAVASLLDRISQQEVWIGLRRRNMFCSSNGSQIAFHSWDYHEPNDKRLRENCVSIGNHGRWSDEECNSTYNVVCKKDIDECLNREAYGCHENAVCLNNIGSFSCNACKKGYTRDGEICKRKEKTVLILGLLLGVSCFIILLLLLYILRKNRRWVW